MQAKLSAIITDSHKRIPSRIYDSTYKCYVKGYAYLCNTKMNMMLLERKILIKVGLFNSPAMKLDWTSSPR